MRDLSNMPFTSDIRYLSLNIQTYKLRILSISQGNAVSQNKAKAVDEANRPDVFVGGARAKKIGPRRGIWLAGGHESLVGESRSEHFSL